MSWAVGAVAAHTHGMRGVTGSIPVPSIFLHHGHERLCFGRRYSQAFQLCTVDQDLILHGVHVDALSRGPRSLSHCRVVPPTFVDGPRCHRNTGPPVVNNDWA